MEEGEKRTFLLPNYFRIELEDNTRFDQFNEGFKFERSWYGKQEDGQILSIEDFFYMCRDAARAMGFADKTVDEWFEV